MNFIEEIRLNLNIVIKINMIKRKRIRSKGKIMLSRYFQEFKTGDKVSVIRELTLNPKFPKKMQGKSGVIQDKRGDSYLIKIKDLNKEKTYIIHPIHLKKLI